MSLAALIAAQLLLTLPFDAGYLGDVPSVYLVTQDGAPILELLDKQQNPRQESLRKALV